MNEPPILTEIVPGLYQIGSAGPGQATWAYYLLQSGASFSTPPSLQQTWTSTDPSMIGSYLFLDRRVDAANARDFVVAAREYCSQQGIGTSNGSQLIAWLRYDPAAGAFPYQGITVQLGVFEFAPPLYIKSSQNPSVIFEWAQIGLEPAASFGLRFQNTGVAFALAGGTMQIWALIAEPSPIQVSYFGQGQPNNNLVAPYPFNNYPLDPSDPSWYIELPLAGPATGSLCFGAGFTPGDLYQNFGCAFQFNYGESNSITYPLFQPQQPGPRGYLGLLVRLHPLFPYNTECSRLALDLSGTGPGASYSQNSLKLRANYFSTPAGSSITLTPCAAPGNESPTAFSSPQEYTPPGFAFSRGPAASGTTPTSPDADWQHYMSPMGHFEITASGSPSADPDRVDLMGGLFAQEYLSMGLGDWVEFLPNKEAYAPGFASGTASPAAASPDQSTAMTSRFTTSWMKYPSGPAFESRAYFSQVSSSVYYGQTQASGTSSYPMAVRSLYSHLDDADPILFPIAPYGGVYASWDGNSSPNQNLPGQTVTEFESQVLTAARHSRIPANEYGPIFLPPQAGSKMVLAARRGLLGDEAPSMPTTHTPQGILVRLNQGGSPGPQANTWNELLLAVSPDAASPAPGMALTIAGPAGQQIVDPVLSNVLMKNQLFLVVSDPTHLGTFQNELSMGGFNFQLDVGAFSPNSSNRSTILIFKFNTSASLEQLAAQPSLWAGTSDFVLDVQAAQTAIQDAIHTARSHADATGDPFQYFNEHIAVDPTWTGILALNCAINGNGMPPDFQMLLGGIKGQLRAHHFGIQMNKLQSGSPEGALSQSSLFAVIFYRNPDEFASPPPPPQPQQELDYEVETLTVVFTNSVITQFAVEVGLTINRLFGRETHLLSPPSSPPPPNTLVISGQYQKQGAVGTVTFATDVPFAYELPETKGATRVIHQVLINQASLVPISSTPASHGTAVKANFNMGGEIFFREDPFPNSGNLDLFSYGTSGSKPTGIAFTGLTANISFQLDAAGTMEPGSKTVLANLDALTFNPSDQSIRGNSLMDALPLQLSRFIYAPGGITQAATGTVPIHVLQLEGGSQRGSPTIAPQSPYGTTKPQFALEYDLPLGSLGSLSDGVGIMAKLLLAWGPSQVVPENDGAAVLVQLPSLSAGLFGFTLQGILKTTFGDANLLKVDLDSGETVYAILFNNIQLSVFGYSFPPGVVTDFTLFAGAPDSGAPRNTSNIGWFLATHQT